MAMMMTPVRMMARATRMPMRKFMFMLSATTAEANSRSQPSLNVWESEKAAGLPREYLVSLEISELSQVKVRVRDRLTCFPEPQ